MEEIKEWFDENLKLMVVYIMLIVVMGGEVFLFYRSFKKEERKENIPIVLEDKVEVKTKETVTVEIKGEVKKPGVYTLENGKRVNDVIKSAGGLTSKASTKANNLSMQLKDEMVIIIYSKEEIKEFIKIKEEERKIEEECKKTQSIITNDSCNEIKEDNKKEDDEDKLISINTASKEELMKLPGIGESKANTIITYRAEHGEFKNIEDIKNVSGIGDSIYNQIKDLITI